MNKHCGATDDHVHNSRVDTHNERKDSSLPFFNAATVVTPVQIPTLSSPSTSGFASHSMRNPNGGAAPNKDAIGQSSGLRPRSLSLASDSQDKGNASFSFPITSSQEMPLRPRESWEMISDSYSIGTQSEDDCEITGSCEEARKTDAQVKNEKSCKASSLLRSTTVGTGAFVRNEKEDVERQEHKEDKYPLRKQLSGLPLVTKSDDDIWPSRQTQITRAQAVQESNLPTWPYKLNPLRKLGRRQRFAAKVAIAILIVGSAVGIGVGVSGVAGGNAVQVAIKPKPIT